MNQSLCKEFAKDESHNKFYPIQIRLFAIKFDNTCCINIQSKGAACNRDYGVAQKVFVAQETFHTLSQLHIPKYNKSFASNDIAYIPAQALLDVDNKQIRIELPACYLVKNDKLFKEKEKRYFMIKGFKNISLFPLSHFLYIHGAYFNMTAKEKEPEKETEAEAEKVKEKVKAIIAKSKEKEKEEMEEIIAKKEKELEEMEEIIAKKEKELEKAKMKIEEEKKKENVMNGADSAN